MHMKKLILVGSPPASGKTFVAKKIASNLSNPVYLDKDTLIPLSKPTYLVANQPYSRDSDFFNKYLRDPEYEAIIDVGMEAINYNDYVIINAPFTKEFRNFAYLQSMRQKLRDKDAELELVWVYCDIKLIHERMIGRNSDRDTWKLQNWEEYVKKRDFTIPSIDGLTVVENTTEEWVQKQVEEFISKKLNKFKD